MDVKSTYLIDPPVYMRLPPRYTQKEGVAKVNRVFYGLCQSGNLWHKTLSSAFDDLGLTRSAVDHRALFYSHNDSGTMIVCTSTDDFAITGTPVS